MPPPVQFTRARYGADILRAMRALGPTTCLALRAPTGLKHKVLRRLLAELARDGLVCRAGHGAGTRWVVGTHPPASIAKRARRVAPEGADLEDDDADAMGTSGRYVSRPRTPVYESSPWVGKSREELSVQQVQRSASCSASREARFVVGTQRQFWGWR